MQRWNIESFYIFTFSTSSYSQAASSCELFIIWTITLLLFIDCVENWKRFNHYALVVFYQAPLLMLSIGAVSLSKLSIIWAFFAPAGCIMCRYPKKNLYDNFIHCLHEKFPQTASLNLAFYFLRRSHRNPSPEFFFLFEPITTLIWFNSWIYRNQY